MTVLASGSAVASLTGSASTSVVFPVLGVAVCVAVRLAALEDGLGVPTAPSEHRNHRRR